MSCEENSLQNPCPEDTSIPSVDNSAMDCCHEHPAKCIQIGVGIVGYGIQSTDSLETVIVKLVNRINSLEDRIETLEQA